MGSLLFAGFVSDALDGFGLPGGYGVDLHTWTDVAIPVLCCYSFSGQCTHPLSKRWRAVDSRVL